MTTDTNRKIKQCKRMMILSFGLLMLLYAASKDPNLPSEWTGMQKVQSGNQTPKSSNEFGSDCKLHL